MPHHHTQSGRLEPVVFLPRFTTLAGKPGSGFQTFPLRVDKYEGALITLWRGPVLGSTPPALSCAFSFLQSTDRVIWTEVSGGSAQDPGEDEELEVELTPTKKWMRMLVLLDGIQPSTTCWAQGFLVRRER